MAATVREDAAEESLVGAEIALTGRLASMSHDEAARRLVEARAELVPMPRRSTSYLVVGQDGPPLGEDGRLTHSLRRALELRQEGAALRIVGEEELLELLGLDEQGEGLRRLYTTEQLARILDIAPARIRAWVRHGLIEPARVVRRLCFFDFRQVASARRLRGLTANGVTPTRIRRSLERLSAWMPQARGSLAQLETIEEGGVLVVRTTDGGLAEPSGQRRLDFDPAGREEPQGALLDPHPPQDAGELWFERAVAAEEQGDLAGAVDAYRRSLAEGGPLPEILFNLGNSLYAMQRKADAAQYLARATEVDPEFVEAWNNLGNALSESGETGPAIDAFHRALELEPAYADAHYNLAETFAAAGRIGEARTHWKAYLLQDPTSRWADVVRERLERTGGMGPC